MDTLKIVNKAIRRSAKKGGTAFLYSYLDNEKKVLKLLQSYNGIKSEIYIKEVDSELKNYVRFSSLFSDITTINTTPSSVADTQITYFTPDHKYFRERKLTIPSKYVSETGIDPKRFLPCYYHRNDQEVRKLFQDYKPMLENNRLVIRPLRGLYVGFPEKQHGNLYYVDPNTDDDHWYVFEKQDKEFITIDNGLNTKSNEKLFEIIVPFFSNIDIAILSKILEDEQDLLSSFRIELKKVINDSSNQIKSSQEISQDLLRPHIDAIGRKFLKIQSKHRLGVGVAVGSFALTFTIATLSGKSILEALGASGITSALGGIIMSNSDYYDKLGSLKEDPYYLLWQIKRRS